MSMIINPFAFGGGGGSGDPFWAQVVALLHFQGADGSTTMTDQTGRAWTAVGDAQIDTAQFKFGSSSLLLDGAGDGLSTTPGAGLTFGTNDITIECFIRHPNSVAGSPDIFSQRPGVSGGGVTFRVSSGAKLQFFQGAGLDLITGATSINQAGGWNHVALVRSGTTVMLFIDGVLDASGTVTASFSPVTPSYIGRRADSASSFFNGHIAEFRITNGVARYNAGGFTPPSAPFPDGP